MTRTLNRVFKAPGALPFLKAAVASIAVTLLVGCSGMRVVDTDVTSFAQWPGTAAGPAPTASYRFERLPSQSAANAAGVLSQDELETMTRMALNRYGLINNPTAPALNVQVGASTRMARRYNNGWGSGLGGGVSLGTGTAGSFIGLSFPIGAVGGLVDSPSYLHELSVVMRDARSNAVVFETRAAHSGIWGDTRAVYPAMLDAALQGFPRPPAGTRRVNVEIPR